MNGHTATVEPVRTTELQAQPRQQPRYNLLLWNDNDHTFLYVVNMLAELFGFVPQRGYEVAKAVDVSGRAIVITTTMEHAELKRDQIHAYGKDAFIHQCKGSMWASIEPVE